MARRNKQEPFNPFDRNSSNRPQKKVQKQRPGANNVKNQQDASRQAQNEAIRKKIREAQLEASC